jgi:hypothetical protein
MSQQLPSNWFLRDKFLNALVAWFLVGTLVAAFLGSILQGLLAQAAIAGVTALVALIPPVSSRSWVRMMPWPLLLIASLPQAIGLFQLDFVADIVVGVGLATLALLVVVALQMTTTLRMTPSFATVFVVIAALAVVGLWAVGSAFSAAAFGTAFVKSNDQLMVIFTAAAIGGISTGIAFRWIFRRRLREEIAATDTPGGEYV